MKIFVAVERDFYGKELLEYNFFIVQSRKSRQNMSCVLFGMKANVNPSIINIPL